MESAKAVPIARRTTDQPNNSQTTDSKKANDVNQLALSTSARLLQNQKVLQVLHTMMNTIQTQ